MDKASFLGKVKQANAQADIRKISLAYDIAEKYHHGHKRKTGEPFFEHPVRVTLKYLQYRQDTDGICAGLLHDTVEDTSLTLDKIKKKFGKEVFFIVDGLTKVLDRSGTEDKQRTMRKVFGSGKRDPRIIILKFVDKLDNLETLHALLPDRQKEIIAELKGFYMPRARRLGYKDIAGKFKNFVDTYAL